MEYQNIKTAQQEEINDIALIKNFIKKWQGNWLFNWGVLVAFVGLSILLSQLFPKKYESTAHLNITDPQGLRTILLNKDDKVTYEMLGINLNVEHQTIKGGGILGQTLKQHHYNIECFRPQLIKDEFVSADKSPIAITFKGLDEHTALRVKVEILDQDSYRLTEVRDLDKKEDILTEAVSLRFGEALNVKGLELSLVTKDDFHFTSQETYIIQHRAIKPLVKKLQKSLIITPNSEKEIFPLELKLKAYNESYVKNFLQSFLMTYKAELNARLDAFYTKQEVVLEQQLANVKSQLNDKSAYSEDEYKDLVKVYTNLLNKTEEQKMFRRYLQNNSLVAYDLQDGNEKGFGLLVFLLIGISLGVIMPIFYLIVREIFNTKIETADDLLKCNIPLATTLPILGKNQKAKAGLLPIQSLNIRLGVLANNILKNKIQTTLITSASDKAIGKDMIATELAKDLVARTGEQVLILNLNYHRLINSKEVPSPYKLDNPFNAYNGNNVTSYLKNGGENINLDELTHLEGHQEIKVFDLGKYKPEDKDLLRSRYLGEMFQGLKARYSHIIIDGSSIFPYEDVAFVQDYADLSYVVLRAEEDDKSCLEALEQYVARTSMQNVALILNAIR